ncbi:serine/threonine-protein kinase [Streptomyces sp. NRRL B-24484]|uniref:serine/threonine-protein kinase n=1 Tax=Streptomyces sp. NRRL B-24484 TaxID=1463833 RepID=UPI003B642464
MRLRREDPRIVGPFRLHRRLGAGGMGVVYLGSDRKGQRVALKLIRDELAGDVEFRTRFAREVAAASRIRGGCTARVVDSDLKAERPWLATAYVPGPSLYKRVTDEGPLPWPEAARVGAALADGLVKVHEAGVVHRDLKPSNILLSPRGPRIIDFGIAWSRGASTLTHVGTAVGSPGFLAPEQVRGAAVTPATDVFAFGATLAFALTGESPFGSGASSEVMLYRVVHEEPDLAAVPPVLAPLIGACLAKEPGERPAAAALHERLTELAARATVLGGRGRTAAPQGAAGQQQAQASAPGRPHAPGAGQGPGADTGPGQQTPRPGAGPLAGHGHTPGHGSGQAGHGRTGGQRPVAGGRAVPPGRPPRRAPGQLPHADGQDTLRDRHRTPVRPHTPAPGRPRDRQHTPVPGRPSADSRRRLLRQRLVVFVTVTLGVALAIATAQGCENRSNQGRGPADRTSPTASAPALSLDGATPAASGAPAAAPAAGGASGFGPATGPLPAVDWANRAYSDPAGGPEIRLRDGRAGGDGAQIALSTVLPARYREAPAALVVLRRTEGSVPVDLVELFSFNGGTPVLVASRASAADPQAAAAWRLENGSLLREEKVSLTGATSSTRYTARADGGLEEAWPGGGVSGGSR